MMEKWAVLDMEGCAGTGEDEDRVRIKWESLLGGAFWDEISQCDCFDGTRIYYFADQGVKVK